MKHTKGKWFDTFNLAKERGVRTESGFICFLPKPSHYTGQDERYESELEEYKANAKLIAKSPEMLEALKKVRLSLGMIPHNWHRTTKDFMPEIIKLLKDLE